jgi:hypothetical protein
MAALRASSVFGFGQDEQDEQDCIWHTDAEFDRANPANPVILSILYRRSRRRCARGGVEVVAMAGWLLTVHATAESRVDLQSVNCTLSLADVYEDIVFDVDETHP